MPDPISWGEAAPYYALALVVSYFLGSIPFGLIFTKAAGLGDIRDIGSGNIGATNALRTGNRWVAGGTFLGDMGKGALAVLLARQFGPDLMVIAAFGALVGHLFPVWLKFKGGKGISTYIGVLLALAWPVGLLFCATWLATALLFRISSLAALVASLLSPVYFIWIDQWQLVELSIVLVALVFFAHRANIQRLLAGKEPRIGQKD
ncbi:MAG: glycerol-3-phosphate 1-O-acyltransferase PlsY [Alphaproteobacteria bacterium]|nr:acyl-phosphate glycerol 3-phosphate acyltransferase [Rhodobiaceae bacterium]MBO6542485.1 glycerol-3-phosphate 1-O-acyltransferase PlsY [Alphaproteobacteria bacterium]MBO6628343.1 glycerol-3-phosphate 1-O-acyltransferase PlsY [Alphaproteobacteria bacterium]MDF1624730.1 glycerol-3-phosphate 1-O-acyltransferase PlsY [Parvibaculaceae bacterium]